MNKFKHYIAFSIHGTNAFLIAGTDSDEAVSKTSDLTRTDSRLPMDEQTGTKYLWSKLNNKKTGKPYENPGQVIKRFRELAKIGWKIDEDSYKAFCRANFRSAMIVSERKNKKVH